jgi:hypothetical protein
VSGRVPDFAVAVVDEHRTVILIVECKSHQHEGEWEHHKIRQLRPYLVDEDCDYGILAIGDECRFYKKRLTGDPNNEENTYEDYAMDTNGWVYSWTYHAQAIMNELDYFRVNQRFTFI